VDERFLTSRAGARELSSFIGLVRNGIPFASLVIPAMAGIPSFIAEKKEVHTEGTEIGPQRARRKPDNFSMFSVVKWFND
jgi:hypothetical protein